MSIQRYDMVAKPYFGDVMESNDTGEWCRWSDVERLIEMVNRMLDERISITAPPQLSPLEQVREMIRGKHIRIAALEKELRDLPAFATPTAEGERD